MRLYRTASTLLLEHEGQVFTLPDTDIDALLSRDHLHSHLLKTIAGLTSLPADPENGPSHVRMIKLWYCALTVIQSYANLARASSPPYPLLPPGEPAPPKPSAKSFHSGSCTQSATH